MESWTFRLSKRVSTEESDDLRADFFLGGGTPPRPTVYRNRNDKLQFVAAKIKTKLQDVDFRVVVYCLYCFFFS